MSHGLIELTIHYGEFRQHKKTVCLNLSEDLVGQLLERVELSDEPFSLMLASPSFYGARGGDAVTIRRKKFEMRRSVAVEIASAMVPALMESFGVNDELDGYRVNDMSPEEKAFYREKGRL